jgi:large subunit ribosomal protein L25
MNQFELVAEKREDVGKGASRRLRRDGKLPGIVYGTDKEATMLTFAHHEVMHQLEQEAFYSHILTLKIGKDAKEKVVLKDLQRHPFKRSLLHIDLQRINENEALTMRIPLHYVNEDKCAGVKEGGVVSHLVTELDIVCLPKDLPEYIEVDVLEVNLNETIHLSDLKLPEGVQFYSLLHGGDDAQPVATVHLPKVAEVEEEGLEGAEGVEGVEGEEGVVAVAAAEEEGSKDSDS